jgi:hypothetical protein
MKTTLKFMTGFFLFVTVFQGTVFGQSTGASSSPEKGKLPFEIKMRIQPRFEYGDLLIDKNGQYTTESDLYLRRVRLTGKKEFENVPFGKKAWAEIVVHMDKLEMDFNKGARQDPDYKVGISTAEAVWMFGDEFSLWLGHDMPPFYRNTSSGKLLTFDWISSVGFFDKSTGDKQVHLRLLGKAGKGIFKYWLGYGDGVNTLSKIKSADGSATAVQKKDWGNLFTARVELAPPGWVEAGWDDTAIGKEKYLALGLGYAFQNGVKYETAAVSDATYQTHSYVVDLSGRVPFGKAALTGQAGYINVDKDYSYKKENPNGYWFQTGFLIPGQIIKGQLEPVLKYEIMDYKTVNKIKTKEKILTLGFNHYLAKHNLKWGYNLSMTDYEDQVKVAAQSSSKLQHQIQFQFEF